MEIIIYIFGWIALIALILGGLAFGLMWFWAKMMGMPD